MSGSENETMIRVVITGSHSVGKTTLANGLAEQLSALGITSAVAEEPIEVVRRQHPKIIAGNPDTLYIKLLEEHFSRLHSSGCTCCLYDRSLIDLLAYYRLEGPGNPAFISLARELLKWYVTWIDLFFYLPMEFPLVADGRRPLSEAYRTQVDEMLKTVAGEAAIEWIAITGNVEERTLKAVEAVKMKHSFLQPDANKSALSNQTNKIMDQAP